MAATNQGALRGPQSPAGGKSGGEGRAPRSAQINANVLSLAPPTETSKESPHVDPGLVLRKQQLQEYKKLCRELQLPESSAIAGVFEPPSQEVLPGGRRMSMMEIMGESVAPLRSHDYDFSLCYLGDRQIRPLAAALAVDRQLQSVRLIGVGMFDKGMAALCEQLKRSPKLELLDVSKNRFSGEGAEACLFLAKCATRLHQVVAKDTVLDRDFCAKRGLPAKFASVRLKLEEILKPRRPKTDFAQLQEQAGKARAEAKKKLAMDMCECGSRFMPDAKFCRACGKPRPSDDVCACGNRLLRDAKFCRMCGAPRPHHDPSQAHGEEEHNSEGFGLDLPPGEEDEDQNNGTRKSSRQSATTGSESSD